jgi:REP element-mobilizing transposase RayT
MALRTWGGARAGAGRPRTPGGQPAHRARPAQPGNAPAHVTLRALPGLPNLRREPAWPAVAAALVVGAERPAFRLVHCSVQSNHLHFLVEAAGADALRRGLQGLSIRLARAINKACGRAGKVWAGRYHARALRTPREVRHALCYVLQNYRRHAGLEGGMVEPGWLHPCSSALAFDGWRDDEGVAWTDGDEPPRLPAARTWLLTTGWRRHGLIGVDEVPAAGA